MPNFDFDRIIPRENTSSEKCDPQFYASTFPNAPEGSIPLWVADMDFATAPCVEKEIQKRAAHPIFGYTNAIPEVFERISWWQEIRHGYTIEKEDISFYSGVVSAIGIAIRALTKPGDGVLIQEPVYYPFRREIEANHRKLFNNILVNEKNDGYYTIDFPDLEKKLSNPEVKLMILCSPHNPVGRVWKQTEIEKVATLCLENGVILVSDEIHSDLILGDAYFTSVGTLEQTLRDNSIILNSVSKTFNLAGLAMSYSAISNPEIKSSIDKEISLFHYIPHTFGLTGTFAAYQEDGALWVDALCKYLTENMLFVSDYLKKYAPKTKFTPSEGTYLGWIDCRDYSTDQDLLEKTFIQAGVLMDPGYFFGESGSGFMRINCASPKSVLEEGLKRSITALESL